MRSRALEAYLKRRQKDCVKELKGDRMDAAQADPRLKEGMARAFAEVRERVALERQVKRRREDS